MGKITDMSTPSTVWAITSATDGGHGLVNVYGNVSALDQTTTVSGFQGVRTPASVQVFDINGKDLDLAADADLTNVVSDHGIVVLGRDRTVTPRYWQLHVQSGGDLFVLLSAGTYISSGGVQVSGTINVSGPVAVQSGGTLPVVLINTSSVANLSGLYLASGLTLASGNIVTVSGNVVIISGLIQSYITQNPSSALSGTAPTSVAVTASSAQVLAVNNSRKGAVFTNLSGNIVSFGLGTSTNLGLGITLNTLGGTWVMDQFTYTTQQIQAISNVSGSGLGIQEFV